MSQQQKLMENKQHLLSLSRNKTWYNEQDLKLIRRTPLLTFPTNQKTPRQGNRRTRRALPRWPYLQPPRGVQRWPAGHCQLCIDELCKVRTLATDWKIQPLRQMTEVWTFCRTPCEHEPSLYSPNCLLLQQDYWITSQPIPKRLHLCYVSLRQLQVRA